MEIELIHYLMSFPSQLSLLFFLLIYYWVFNLFHQYTPAFFMGLILQLKQRKRKGFEKLLTIAGISMVSWRKTAINHHH